MKNIVILLSLIFFSTPAYCDQSDPVSEAHSLFLSKEYYKGLVLLNRAQRDESKGANYQALAKASLARFHEEIVGDTEKALGYYREILNSGISPDNNIVVQAQNEIKRIETLKKQYLHQDRLLDMIKRLPGNLPPGDTVEKLRSALSSMIKENPDYYRLGEAHYFLGLLSCAEGEYRDAYNSFNQAIEARPGIDFFHPVKANGDKALKIWTGLLFKRLIWGCTGFALVLTVIIFYLSRPWTWLRSGHLALALILIILWFMVFHISFWWLGHNFQVNNEITGEILSEDMFEEPLFISAEKGSPDSYISYRLFSYGLLGIAGTFLFSIGISRLKKGWIVFTVTPIFATLLFTCLVSIFCYRHYDKDLIYNIIKGRDMNRITANLYFDAKDPEPYILTTPKKYPNLKLLNITDIYFKEWVIRYCPDPRPYE